MAFSISVTQAKWDDEQCRVENGIFFSDDTVILLSGSPQDGYVASARLELASVLENYPDGWTHVVGNPACRAEAGEVIVVAGGTSWEAEGFVAALSSPSGELLWILHLQESEVFVELSLECEDIRARSAEYPHEYEWRIPLRKPEMLKVNAVNRK